MGSPFSFAEIEQIADFDFRQPSFTLADDATKLAYYAFIPASPQAIVIFYHGAGLYGNKVHQWIGKELQEKYVIGTYIVDIRGHGNSGGIRGDAPRVETVWEDISTMINHLRKAYPVFPLYLAGHSSGAGLLLNYAVWNKREHVDGIILLAPYLGPLSGAVKEHKSPDQRFVKKMRNWVYVLARLTGGKIGMHIPSVYFNYPNSITDDKKILIYYTYAMSCATTPYQVKNIFEELGVPTGMFIAADDEQFIAHAIA